MVDGWMGVDRGEGWSHGEGDSELSSAYWCMCLAMNLRVFCLRVHGRRGGWLGMACRAFHELFSYRIFFKKRKIPGLYVYGIGRIHLKLSQRSCFSTRFLLNFFFQVIRLVVYWIRTCF